MADCFQPGRKNGNCWKSSRLTRYFGTSCRNSAPLKLSRTERRYLFLRRKNLNSNAMARPFGSIEKLSRNHVRQASRLFIQERSDSWSLHSIPIGIGRLPAVDSMRTSQGIKGNGLLAFILTYSIFQYHCSGLKIERFNSKNIRRD